MAVSAASPRWRFVFRLLPILPVIAFTCSQGRAGQPEASERMTPLLLAVTNAPEPFVGSDGRVHLVYELGMTNFSSGEIAVEKAEVLGDGVSLLTLDAAAVATRLQNSGERTPTGTLARSTQAMLFVHVVLPPGATAPARLLHRISFRASAAPPEQREITESGGPVAVDRRAVAILAPPLRGAGYLSADSCCDASRHTRAALPVNGKVWLAQRFAVDWEQLNEHGRIYQGEQSQLTSYTIFGKPVLAVANATVVSTVDGEPEQTPGKFPVNIALAAADGNAVILDLGSHRYALYAHLQPGSLRVHRGDRVVTGQVIGLVGDSGNSIVPHLHFQVMDGPSSMSSNGCPYEVTGFTVIGKTEGTAAFDEAESKGTPLAITAEKPPRTVRQGLPLDQQVIGFPGPAIVPKH